MREYCTCSDCAVSEGHIEKIAGEITEVFVIHTMTKKHEDMGAYEGDECEVDHDHAKSKSCGLMYQCDNCGEQHADADEATSCCVAWECTHCGWTFHDSYYQSARSKAAECCVTSCDECGTTGWPSQLEWHNCEREGHGMRRQLPWEARGIVVDGRCPQTGTDWKATWGYNFEDFNVVRAAADYYLLEAISAGLVGTTDGNGNVRTDVASTPELNIIRSEASDLMDELVRTWDPMLIAYTHMAVGGELRHHNAVGGEVLDGNRDRAWSGWKLIFEAVGTDALTDAAELFREFTGGSFGGDPWAQACEILHARLTGKIKPQMFLDRIFNAQHNGGCLLNKVSWRGDRARYESAAKSEVMSLNEMTYNVLPAHGAEPEPDYSTLLAYASTEVRRLFDDAFVFAGHGAYARGIALNGWRRVKPTVGYTKAQRYDREQAEYAAKMAAEAAKPKSQKYYDQYLSTTKYLQQYQQMAAEEAAKNAVILEQIAAGEVKPECGCSNPECMVGTGYSTDYADSVEYYANLQLEQYNKWQAQVAWELANPAPAYKAPVIPDNHCNECGTKMYCTCCSTCDSCLDGPYYDDEGDFDPYDPF